MSQRDNKELECPIQAIVDVIGGKWKLSILYQLFQGTRRYGELKRLVPKATERMLTLQLRELEAVGIVQRTVYSEVPPKVEYSLTELGLSLEPVLKTMLSWSENYLQQEGTQVRESNSNLSSL
ncbi:MAG: helix-turn-helix transcriptional regulator [Leptolyngbyaceae cyanobacterium SM1_1_3]|nr:helix-turn-helix transcriptional regulator [Leptolyngbyaceae cyanobacterium SM1_1_3]NJN03635.1 helix-turn-helix transcriptional regulator [Leptolyngbyaceae cyanobacterium RM1_1_2]NJO10092.1 helix-turn-helix transcriptional regulator [Leptolyngbyaceae cyanobacterium SL_1_1]